jgi:hypothetical protein
MPFTEGVLKMLTGMAMRTARGENCVVLRDLKVTIVASYRGDNEGVVADRIPVVWFDGD